MRSCLIRRNDRFMMKVVKKHLKEAAALADSDFLPPWTYSICFSGVVVGMVVLVSFVPPNH